MGPVSTLGSENGTQKNNSMSSFCNLRKFNLMLRAKVMTIFPRSPIWNVIQEFEKTLTSSYHISPNIVRQTLKFGPEVQNDFSSNAFLF